MSNNLNKNGVLFRGYVDGNVNGSNNTVYGDVGGNVNGTGNVIYGDVDGNVNKPGNTIFGTVFGFAVEGNTILSGDRTPNEKTTTICTSNDYGSNVVVSGSGSVIGSVGGTGIKTSYSGSYRPDIDSIDSRGVNIGFMGDGNYFINGKNVIRKGRLLTIDGRPFYGDTVKVVDSKLYLDGELLDNLGGR